MQSWWCRCIRNMCLRGHRAFFQRWYATRIELRPRQQMLWKWHICSSVSWLWSCNIAKCYIVRQRKCALHSARLCRLGRSIISRIIMYFNLLFLCTSFLPFNNFLSPFSSRRNAHALRASSCDYLFSLALSLERMEMSRKKRHNYNNFGWRFILFITFGVVGERRHTTPHYAT